MSNPSQQMAEPSQEIMSQSQNSSCKWRVRWFYSKGAFMVIVWNFLITLVLFSELFMVADYVQIELISQPMNSLLIVLPLVLQVLLILSFPVSGWLADAKYGKYNVFKTGIILMFLSALIGCVTTLARENLGSTLTMVGYTIAFTLLYVGYGACLTTTTQLGLDQMPDASSENTMSFIAWYVFSTVAGIWSSGLLHSTINLCVNHTLRLIIIQSFLLAVCMSVVLISDYLLTSKWLIIEPKSPQALRNMYQVLRFAVNHKSPVDRSALTYWEERIPSRLDLGMSKYGGPFTTEQVEDVKTILRILVVSVPICLFYALATLKPFSLDEFGHIPNLSLCASSYVFSFSYSGAWCFFLCTILQEFVVYPLTRGRVPTTLNKIEAASFAFTAVVAFCTVLIILDYSNILSSAWAVRVIFLISGGCVFQVLLTSVTEFVCAQSPYNMRGLLVGYIFFQVWITIEVCFAFSGFFVPWCNTQDTCPVLLWSVFSVLCMLSFLLICCASRKYKRRVRDDQYFAQAVIEDIYDRRLTAAATHKSYQTMYN